LRSAAPRRLRVRRRGAAARASARIPHHRGSNRVARRQPLQRAPPPRLGRDAPRPTPGPAQRMVGALFAASPRCVRASRAALVSVPDRRPGAGSASSGALLVVLAVAVLVRFLLLRVPRLWYDEATSGLLALSVLKGELPVYFFGQSFMGALDGYLAAPVLW